MCCNVKLTLNALKNVYCTVLVEVWFGRTQPKPTPTTEMTLFQEFTPFLDLFYGHNPPRIASKKAFKCTGQCSSVQYTFLVHLE